MKYQRFRSSERSFKLQIVRDGVVYAEWEIYVDNSGLAALLRTVDKATTEAQAVRSIGLRRQRRKHVKHD